MNDVFQILVILGNFAGWIVFAFYIDRKIDRKIDKIWLRIRGSPEGKDAAEVLKEARKFLKSPELTTLMHEMIEVVSEARVLLKTLKERMETPPEEDGEATRELLPSLGQKSP